MSICRNPLCGLDHDPRVRCQQAKALNAAPQGLKPTPPVQAEVSVVAAPIRKVEEFLRKVGRPRKHSDRKAYKVEWTRRKRAKDRAGSVG